MFCFVVITRLSLLSSNIQAEQETLLRSYLTKRLERLHPLEGSGSITSIPAGQVYEKSAMVYFYLMSEEYASDDCPENKRFLSTLSLLLEVKQLHYLMSFLFTPDS